MSLDYITYSDIIFEHFFNPSRKGQATALAFDEEESQEIARSVGDPPSEFSGKVIKSVRDIYRSTRGFDWWRDRHPRERTALLACSVLVISSASTDDDHIEGFYKEFYRDILGVETGIKQNEYAIHSPWWEELRAYLNEECLGALGRIVFLQVVKYSHLNYPASQSILRGSDRRWLWDFFSRSVVDPATALTRERFLAIWRPNAPGQAVGVARMGQKLRDSDEASDQIWDIFSGEYEAWRNDPAQRETIDQKRGHRGSRASVRRSGNIIIGNDEIAGEDSGESARVHSRYALSRPTFPVNEPYMLRLDITPNAAITEPELADGWVRIAEQEVSAEQFINGFRQNLFGLEVSVRAHSVACFVDGEAGFTEVNAFPSGQRVVLIYEDSDSEISEFASQQLKNSSDVKLDQSLDGLRASAGTLSPALSETDMPAAVQQLFSKSNIVLSLRHGLRLRNGFYLEGAPPNLYFIHPQKSFAPLLLDGVEVATAERGLNRLPSGISPGIHAISVLNHERYFRIAFPDEIASESPDLRDNELGFIIRSRPPLVQTQRSATFAKTDDLKSRNEVVVQGADILLPYTRTS